MADIPDVRRLADWFDAIVFPGTAPEGLGERLRAVGDGLPLFHTGADVDGWTPLGDLGASQDRRQIFADRLSTRGVKRPLVWLQGGVDADLAEALPESFALAVADADLDRPWIDRADVVMARAPGRAGRAGEATYLITEAESADPAALAQAAHNLILDKLRQGLAGEKRLNILVLYNDLYTHIQAIREHLLSFSRHSRHNYFYMAAAETLPTDDRHHRMFDDYREVWPQAWDLSLYDAVIWHFIIPAYRTPTSWEGNFMARTVATRLAQYDGLKILFVQDEYDSTQTIWQAVREAGVHLVMTCVPAEGVTYAYPPHQVPGVEFIQTLTGYVPDEHDLDRFALPMEARETRLAYRGRALPFRYGSLGREKYEIGIRMEALTAERGIKADIDVRETRRIYGDDWYRFLGSARGMLATESGSNVFDFDGALGASESEAKDMDYETFFAKHLAHREGFVRMNQISPKVFEAISLRTALVCFEGEYSGVIKPDLHFIALKKDFSNADEVFARLEDVEGLKAMTERAYRDVIGSGRYGYAAFVARFDTILERRMPRPARAEIISAPILVRRRGQDRYEAISRPHALEYVLNTGVLYGDFKRRELEQVMGEARDAEFTPYRSQGPQPSGDAEVVFEAGPEAVVCYDFWRNAGADLQTTPQGARLTTPPIPWHYAGGINLDFSEVDFAQDYCWVRLTVSDVEREVYAALYSEAEDAVFFQAVIAPGPATQQVFLKIAESKGRLMVIRTGFDAAASGVTILKAEVIRASAYRPSVESLLRERAALRTLRED